MLNILSLDVLICIDFVIKLVSFLTQPLACGHLSANPVEGDNRASVKKSKRQTLEGSGTMNFIRFRVEEGAPKCIRIEVGKKPPSEQLH